MKLIMKLLSDTCIASGNSIVGIIDSEIEFDELGIPYIPSKRLKGILRENSQDLEDICEEYNGLTKKLFGSAGDNYEGSKIIIGNGYIKSYDILRENINKGLNTKNFNILFNEYLVKNYFTYMRNQTSIEKSTGTSKENSLRCTRTIKKGLIFEFEINTLNKELTQHEKTFLEESCKLVRNIGMNRTRGYGQVECKLDTNEKKDASVLTNLKLEKNCIAYTLKFKAPVILNNNYVPGSMILGAFASKYLKKHNLNSNTAHNDKEFRKLFLSSDVKYLNAYLSDIKNTRLLPIPLSIVRKKDENLNIVYDLANSDTLGEVFNSEDQYQNIDYDYGLIDENKIFIKSIDEQYYYHHRRPQDKTIGHSINGSGKFFQYKAINKNTIFKGYILGKKDDLLKLIELFKEDNILYLGAARTSQYGKTEINFYDESLYDLDDIDFDEDENITVTFTSPMILLDENGFNTVDIKYFTEQLGSNITIIDKFIKTVEIGGYNAKWGMPKPQFIAIKEGSVITVRSRDILNIDKIMEKSYGIRVNEGFGRIAINYHGIREDYNLKKLNDSNKYDSIISIYDFKDKPTKKFVKYALEQVLIEKLMKNIYDPNSSLKNIKESVKNVANKSLIGNLIIMLKVEENFNKFQASLEKASERSTNNGKIENNYCKILNILKENDDLDPNNCSIENNFTFYFEREILENLNIFKTGDEEYKEFKECILKDKDFIYKLFKESYIKLLNHIKLEKRGEK